MESSYCRLCAELKSAEKLLNLQNDEGKCVDIALKLSFLNAVYIDITGNNALPKTVCFVCRDALNEAYVFLTKVQESQDVLTKIYSKANIELEDQTNLEELLNVNSNLENNTVIKPELPKPPDDIVDVSTSIDIKIEKELKVEEDFGCIDNDINSDPASPSSGAYDDTLNVQDFIDAAFSETNFNSNVTLYAKEVTNLSKKTIKSWKDYPWVCEECNIEFLDADTLRSHAKFVHEKCADFFCIDCKIVGKDFKTFIRHVQSHRKYLRNYCHYCNNKINKNNRNEHLQLHFLKHQIPCPLCGEILNDEQELKKHSDDYGSVKPQRRQRRKRGTPITLAELTCKVCNKVYKNLNSLRDHMKRHTGDRKRDYTCERCGKTFFNKGTLTSHIMSHEQIRPHVCRICNKSFLFPNMLRRHVEMHSGVKPFSCEQCGRCFRLKYQLKAHQIVHTDAMPYVCQYCNKTFRFKQILKNHERQHTGAKPYSCQHCTMEFTNWSNYNKHMKRRHATDMAKKKITPEGVFPVNPETGQIMQLDFAGSEEWKNKIMIPAKRGKKKIIKDIADT